MSPEKPCPSSPSRRSSGTKQSSRCSSPAGKQRLPIFGRRSPRRKPSSPCSTTNAVIPFARVPGEAVRGAGAPAAAVLGRQVVAGEAKLRRPRELLVGELLALVVRERDRTQLALGELARGRDEVVDHVGAAAGDPILRPARSGQGSEACASAKCCTRARI